MKTLTQIFGTPRHPLSAVHPKLTPVQNYDHLPDDDEGVRRGRKVKEAILPPTPDAQRLGLEVAMHLDRTTLLLNPKGVAAALSIAKNLEPKALETLAGVAKSFRSFASAQSLPATPRPRYGSGWKADGKKPLEFIRR